MELFRRLKEGSHEQVIFFRDQHAGLRAIIAIHNTTLGPAIGGVRMGEYTGEDAAIDDALKLSRALTYKAACARVNFGGGHTVVVGDPKCHKSEALFRALGRFIDSLNGRYVAAEGVGTTVEDMDYIRMETKYVVGIPSSKGGSGDPSPVCAFGVFRGLEACRMFLSGSDDVKGLRVAVQGVGRVGSRLVDMLAARGAVVTVADPDPEAIARVTSKHAVSVVSPEEIYGVDCDFLSPCAMGGVINDDTVGRLKCRVVAGSANNQLAEERHGAELHKRGILYAPDYIINGGGLINVAEEIPGYDRERAMRKTASIRDVLLKVLDSARENAIPTYEAADRFAEARIEKVGRVRRSYLAP
ncbi:MAG: Glu/Leu/Phe/Val dehydrogenase dimerization domain-containing protein [Candidatus Eisenbacteria bacterium]